MVIVAEGKSFLFLFPFLFLPPLSFFLPAGLSQVENRKYRSYWTSFSLLFALFSFFFASRVAMGKTSKPFFLFSSFPTCVRPPDSARRRGGGQCSFLFFFFPLFFFSPRPFLPPSADVGRQGPNPPIKVYRYRTHGSFLFFFFFLLEPFFFPPCWLCARPLEKEGFHRKPEGNSFPFFFPPSLLFFGPLLLGSLSRSGLVKRK